MNLGIVLAIIGTLCILFGIASCKKKENSPAPVKVENSCKLVRVSDGDSVIVKIDGKVEKLRLSRIDAPELRQSYGKESKAALQEKLKGATLTYEFVKEDFYHRWIVELRANDVNISDWMVATGNAWQFDKYDQSIELNELEAEARENKRGLWKNRQVIAPWEWRKKK